jgi:hypothetical protein
MPKTPPKEQRRISAAAVILYAGDASGPRSDAEGRKLIPLGCLHSRNNFIRLNKPDRIEASDSHKGQSLSLATPNIDVQPLAEVVNKGILASSRRLVSGLVPQDGHCALLTP